MATKAKDAATALPVILVHGFMSTAEMLSFLAQRLKGHGFDVHTSDLSPFCIQDVRKLAEDLGRTVESVLEETKAPSCHLVGLSQGGIISLYYIKFIDKGEHARRLVAAASPFQGTWAPVYGVLSMPVLGLVSRGVWQVMPNSMLLNELHNAPTPQGVKVTTIGVEGDLVAPPDRCRLPDARHVVVEGLPLISHQWAVFSHQVADAIAEALETGR